MVEKKSEKRLNPGEKDQFEPLSVTVYIPKELFERSERLRKKRFMNRSEFYRNGLRELCEKLDNA